MTLQEFFDKNNGKGIDLLKSFSTSGFVNPNVVSPGGNHEVGGAVVSPVSVNVVDDFVRPESPSKPFLRQFPVARPAMFPSRVICGSLVLKDSLAFSSAKRVLASLMASIVRKGYATLITSKDPTPGLVIAISITESGSLTWRSLKWVTTLFTNVLHCWKYSMQCVEVSI